MYYFNIKFFISIAFTFIFFNVRSQTLIMNEVSNGPSGSQEYVEFVVVSNTVTYNCSSPTPPCIDIRGWIFDDNSGYHGASGVAAGAIRFSQNSIWSCIPLGTIILLYNDADKNPDIPATDDLSMADGNCTIIAPVSNASLFERNTTTPGAAACSYPSTGWVAGGTWSFTALANTSDCARIVNLSGCEVFSVCYGATDNLNTLIYFPASGGGTVYSFNSIDPQLQANWSSGSATTFQTPGAPNNAANAAYIAQFNNGCMPITQPSITAVTVNAGCTCNGSATANTSGSIGGYTYVWYDASMNPIGQTAATATGLCAGIYNVTSTSQIGCTATTSVTITSSSTTSVSVNSQTICAGTSAVLTATPSTTGGTFSWSPNGLTTSSISVNPSSTTTYSVIYTIAGCATTNNGIVTVNPLPTITVNSQTICAGQTATLIANGASSYTWNTSSSINPLIISPTATTNYTVVGSVLGCTNTAIATISVTPLPTITVNSPTICAGQTATLTANGASTYNWNTGSSLNPLVISPLSTTNYTVGGSTSGCTNTFIATVSVIPIPTLSVNSPVICLGQTATLTATGATTYLWNTGSLLNTITDAPTLNTNYTVTGTTSGCTNTAIANISVTPLPTITVNSQTICAGQTATLIANGASSYTWNTSSSINPLIISPTSTTNYTVVGSVLGCTNNAIAAISVTPLPTVVVNSSTICSGQTATIAASGATSYSWNTGSLLSTLTDAPTTNTTYTVIGAALGCTSTAIANVSVTPLPTVTVTSSTICIGQTATITASGASTYVWNTGSLSNTITDAPSANTSYTVLGSSSNCTNSAIANVSVTPLPTVTVNSSTICSGQTTTLTANGASAYLWNTGATGSALIISPTVNTSFSVVGTNAGCSNTVSTIVNVVSSPSLSVNSTTICSGQTTTLSVSGASSYIWNNGTTTNTAVVSPVATTIFSVVGSIGTCSTTTTVNVVVNPLPIISVPSKTICSGQSATLTANGATSYSWSNNTFNNTLIVYPNVTTIYTVTGTNLNCSASATAVVSVEAIPTINFNSNQTSGCAPLCIQFTDFTTITSGTISNWSWDFNDGFTSNFQSPSHCFDNEGSYNITLTVTSSNGCSNLLVNPNMINVFPNPIAEFQSDFEETDILNPIINFSNLSLNANAYVWNFGDTTSTLTNPIHAYDNEGTYSTTLTATNQFGCKDVAIHDIIIKGIFTFYAPNTFTPNNDNLNDVFIPLGVGWNPDKYQLEIFDRWGNNCFNTSEVGRGWDGKANNGSNPAQIDTYTWKVNLTDVFGTSHNYIGRITIIR